MATITLKNVPQDTYERLKRDAARNRRSLNQEVIVQLAERTSDKDAILAQADALREKLAWNDAWATAAEIDAWIEYGRP